MDPHYVFLDFGLFEVNWYGFLIGLAVLALVFVTEKIGGGKKQEAAA